MEGERSAIDRLRAVAATLAVAPALSVTAVLPATVAAAGQDHPAVGQAARTYLAGLEARARHDTAYLTDDVHGAFD